MTTEKTLSTNVALNPDSKIRTTRPLSEEQIAKYHEDGFVIVPGFFDPEEVEPLRIGFEEDSNVRNAQISVKDTFGKVYKVATWTDLSNALLGVLPRMARVVEGIEVLLGEECYFWHAKLVRKPPYSEGSVEWHQGYAFWYESCLFPHIVTCTIAVDKCTKENGCLQIVKKSHLLGRINMDKIGETLLTEPARMEKVLEKLEVVYCQMEPGDAVFFHANAVHGSEPNKMVQPRTLIHCVYNAVSNEPFRTEGQEHRLYRPLQKLPDSIIKDCGYDSVLDKHEFYPAEKLNIVDSQTTF